MYKTMILLVAFGISIVQSIYGNVNFESGEREWTIVQTYSIPGKASGLAWDGQYLYSGTVFSGDDNILYRIDPSDGSYEIQCTAPIDGAYGLTFDETTGNLWTTNHPGAYDPALAIQFSLNGNLISQFNLPATYFSGIAWDNDDFWANCYYDPDGEVYKVDGSGNILNQFSAPADQPWDICLMDEFLWLVDYDANTIYKMDQDGNIEESHASEGVKPAGIVFDGSYLWYCDGGLGVNSTLYKINLGGAGTPEITVPVTEHDYGMVEISTTDVWNCSIENSGTAELEVTYGSISGEGSEYINWPEGDSFTIAAGDYTTISIEYNPLEAGPLNASAFLESNDPVTGDVELQMTGTAVHGQPYLKIIENTHDYSTVRIDATTRWYLQIQNYGNETLTIEEISLNIPQYYIDQYTVLPIDISPLTTVKIGIWFSPDNNSNFNGTAIITSNDGYGNPDEVALTGSGLLKDWELGDVFWSYQLPVYFDNSIKAIGNIQDVSNDGKGDVIVCAEDDYIRCFNGNAHGITDLLWEHEIYAGSVFGQNGLKIADITGDDNQEVIVGTTGSDRSVTILTGSKGDVLWKFNTNQYGSGGWVYQVDASFDFNGDGIIDVLAATGDDSYDTGPKRVFCLNGTDGEVVWDCYLSGPVFSVIGVHDYTGDNLPDVIAGASNNDESQGLVFGIDGADGTILWSRPVSGTSVWGLCELDDTNNSGTFEIAAGDFSGQVYIIDPNTEDIVGQGSIGNDIILRLVQMDDVNNDGLADILVASSSNHAFILDGKNGSAIVSQALHDKCWNVARIEDVSGDGVNDFVAGTLFTANYAYFMDGVTGEDLFSQNFSEAIDGINTITDINNDGSMEMVVGGRMGKLVCYSGGLHATVGLQESSTDKPQFAHIASPNPFTKEVKIKFDLPERGPLKIVVFDVMGKEITILLDKNLEEGRHEVTWYPTVKGSTFYYRIFYRGETMTGKLIKLN